MARTSRPTLPWHQQIESPPTVVPRLRGQWVPGMERMAFGGSGFRMNDRASPRPTAEQSAWLRLKLTPGLGNRSLLRLLEFYGSPQAVLGTDLEQLREISGMRTEARRALLQKQVTRDPNEEWTQLMGFGAQMICLGDRDYPENLKDIPDPPAVLFVKGNLEPRDLVAIAVVGSRFASPMGLNFTRRLCSELAGAGVTVVSGLAMGIDTAAHWGALNGKGRTLAVLGCGLDVPYPRSNTQLKGAITGGAGALLTELPLGSPPLAGHFPMRNRIISGLALGVVVVEAANRSGSLITARLALEQGREVFAVPGLARHDRSVGPHRLLRQGAKLVECAEDILEEIRPLIQPTRPAPAIETDRAEQTESDASPEQRELLQHLSGEPCQIDRLCAELGWPVPRLAALLTSLELKGLVRQLPGKFFERV